MSRGPGDVSVAGSLFTHPELTQATGYHFELSVTKNDSGNFDMVYSINSTIVSSQSIAAGDLATSDDLITGIAFRHGSGGGVTYLDNVFVEVIPEPATAGLLMGLCVFGSIVCMRRR
ncbi:PEP-CTERM sorting domain-containing protein [Coraliomargarita algicola]|uniref:PEP-CTERM sorting domain-containing protein n=1 Tax=Coraliomargarita algicola TaxID=3092156 RepID=A0ABZ0RLM8_9BACT|nr:PEP-CTERM sorting domain-containing protein [Coraliomargarita sp. J2-16]WPJ96331.1 PEP-CTERM sorting domain-containing protein [Coraliomargarita sp. J2-16]